jgi:hypothetical protein
MAFPMFTQHRRAPQRGKTMKRFAILLLLASSAIADERFVCGNDDERTLRRVQALGEVSRLRPRHAMAAQSAPLVEERNGVYIVQSDELTAPFARKFDLDRKSLHFTPAGADAYSVQTVPLDVRGRGTRIEGSYHLQHFGFPFGGTERRDLLVSSDFAIHFGTATDYDTFQLAPYELASIPGGVISPLYRTLRQSPRAAIQLFVEDTPAAATFTWAGLDNTEVQAALFPNGEIRFSYTRVPVGAGGVLISTGNEVWRAQRTELAARNDGADVTAGNAALRPMIDIERLTVNRIADRDVVEFRIDVRGPISPSLLGANEAISYEITFEGFPITHALSAEIEKDRGPSYSTYWSGGTSPAAYLDGKSMVMRVDQEFLESLPDTVQVVATVRGPSMGDTTTPVPFNSAATVRRVASDLSAFDGATLAMPIIESFTLPALNPEGVWTRLREQLPALMKDETLDAVAIYQTFPTDLVFYASAYSTGGVTGARGLRFNDANWPTARTPALLHMNQAGMRVNVAERSSSHVLLHELGHRWLLFVSIMENGVRSNVLKPAGGHPAQWVDTRAAFRVYTDQDASVMGGGVFTSNGNGSFATGPYGFYGYSWLDLYLMGLASPDEVAPFFYLANSNPALGPAYYAPQGTYTGERREVTVQQVIEGTGPRLPAYPNTQRAFRMAMILLTDREPTAQELEFMQMYKSLAERDFRIATGGRGSLTTVLTSPGGRRRATRH